MAQEGSLERRCSEKSLKIQAVIRGFVGSLHEILDEEDLFENEADVLGSVLCQTEAELKNRLKQLKLKTDTAAIVASASEPGDNLATTRLHSKRATKRCAHPESEVGVCRHFYKDHPELLDISLWEPLPAEVKELTNALAGALEAKEKWVDENNWADLNFKQIDQHFDCRAVPLAKPESRKRKYDTLDTRQEDWENDRALEISKLNELNSRANRAEQRVLELEQILRQQAIGAPDDTCDDSDIVNCASQHNGFNEDPAEMLICKMAGCNKSFKSTKTLRRHVLQKHSDNARFLVCNQTNVKGEMCRFETIHSGVLSYHRKHSLAHQRREDWHIACPFCQSRFARQHEMERHRSEPATNSLSGTSPSPSGQDQCSIESRYVQNDSNPKRAGGQSPRFAHEESEL